MAISRKTRFQKAACWIFFACQNLVFIFTRASGRGSRFCSPPCGAFGIKRNPGLFKLREVALLADGTELARRRCDCGPTVPFDEKRFKKTNDNYWMTDEDHVAVSKEVSDLGRHAISCLYDGGNCERVTHPPFTFSGLELGGVRELTLIGYRNEKEAARQTLRRPGPAANCGSNRRIGEFRCKMTAWIFCFSTSI